MTIDAWKFLSPLNVHFHVPELVTISTKVLENGGLSATRFGKSTPNGKNLLKRREQMITVKIRMQSAETNAGWV